VKKILLSIDWDYISMYPEIHGEWKVAYTKAMDWALEFLAEKKLSITFFCCPENATMFPEFVKAISGAGHCVGLHIHSIDRFTPPEDKKTIMSDGKRMLEDLSQQRVKWFRGGMFYLDKDMVAILTELHFRGDSTLLPDRYMEKWISGKYETKHMVFEMPMDYRGFPETLYYLASDLLEVPLSRYSMDFHRFDSMLNRIRNDTAVSVIYLHPKNLGSDILRESMRGRVKQGLINVVEQLTREGYAFVEYDSMLSEEGYPDRFDIVERLYPFDRSRRERAVTGARAETG